MKGGKLVPSQDLGQIEIGLCSDLGGTALAGVRGLDRIRLPADRAAGTRQYKADCGAVFDHLKELIAEYDPAARIDFIETVPPEHRAEEFAEVAAENGIPLKQFTRLCVIGGDDAEPDGLEAMSGYLELARRTGTVDRLNFQIFGNSTHPGIDAIVDFYVRAEEMAQEAGIELLTETHVERYNHDPRRMVAAHEVLQERTGGRLGIRVCADLSHYVHQIDNSHFPQWPSISSGELRLDPFDPDNYVSRNIIESGMVWGGHLRAATPNNLPPGRGSIQYPITDPRADAATADQPNGGMAETWDEGKLKHWMEFYRQVFAYQLRRPSRPVARFASEFIGDGGAGDYRVGPYRNVFQNIAAAAIAQRMIRKIIAELKG